MSLFIYAMNLNILDLRLCHTLSQNFHFFIHTYHGAVLDKGVGHNWTQLIFMLFFCNIFFFRLKMVRRYIKKTNRADISEESIVLALHDYRNDNYRSIWEAAEAHGLKSLPYILGLKR